MKYKLGYAGYNDSSLGRMDTSLNPVNTDMDSLLYRKPESLPKKVTCPTCHKLTPVSCSCQECKKRGPTYDNPYYCIHCNITPWNRGDCCVPVKEVKVGCWQSLCTRIANRVSCWKSIYNRIAKRINPYVALPTKED